MWLCSQIGAREHYNVPRALHRDGRLAALYTDYWAGPVTRRILSQIGKLKPDSRKSVAIDGVRALNGRYHPVLGRAESGRQGSEVNAWNWRALWWKMMLRSQRSVARGPYYGFMEVGRRFALRVREALGRRSDLGADCVFFAYDTGALEALEWCREQRVKCVLNQMDPNRVEVELVRAEDKQWPGWALQTIQVPEEYFVRREREWALADRVVVNSEFSRQALLRQGVPDDKLVVIPLCYETKSEDGSEEIEEGRSIADRRSSTAHRPSSSPLRVLFLGQVILRKGIQYLISAARRLERENIHFDVVGPIGISREAMATAPGNLTFHGRTGRDQAAAWYQRSHLFVLPTISDGFAITQLEAMAHGLPVVTTPCCGEVVRDGVDGFVVPPRDPDALVRVLQRYLSEPGLLPAQQSAALEKSRQFTLARLGENLRRLEDALK